MVETLLDGALTVSRETYNRLKIFESIFHQWASKINLVATSTTDEVWQRHIEDSAQLLLMKPDMEQVVDIGSGGGFPGLILAILLQNTPNSRVDLVESNRKKTAFLQAVRIQCAQRARIHSKRIEDTLSSLETSQYVTARALTSLSKLFELTEPQLAAGSVGLFHKGREFATELEESRANWDFDLIVHKSLIDSDSVVLEIGNLERRNND